MLRGNGLANARQRRTHHRQDPAEEDGDISLPAEGSRRACLDGAGLFGALLAQVVVLIYFALHILVSKISTNLDPVTTMSLAMFSYFAKFLALGAFLWLLGRFTSETLVDRRSFGIAAVALTFAWLGGEITSYLKLKTHLPLPNEPQP